MKKNSLLPMISLLASSAFLLYSSAFAAEYAANNCEIFVDKLKVTTGSHALTNFTFYVKILADKLDAPVAAVEVYHRREEQTSANEPRNFDWKLDRMSNFVGSSDYFEHSVVTGHDWLTAKEEMTFSVLTTNGTRYWANAYNSPGLNFVANSDALNNIAFENVNGRRLYRQDFASRSVFASLSYSSLENIAKTADFPTDLRALYNTKGCR